MSVSWRRRWYSSWHFLLWCFRRGCSTKPTQPNCRGNCNIGHPPESHLKLKYLDVHNPRVSFPIVLMFHTTHGSDTAVLWAKLQNDSVNSPDVIFKEIWVKDEFRENRKLPVQQTPSCLANTQHNKNVISHSKCCFQIMITFLLWDVLAYDN